jgi:hypothetical protein
MRYAPDERDIVGFAIDTPSFSSRFLISGGAGSRPGSIAWAATGLDRLCKSGRETLDDKCATAC